MGGCRKQQFHLFSRFTKNEDKFGSKKGLPGLVKNNQRLEENNQQVFLIDNAPIATHPLLRASGITTQSLLLHPPPSSLYFLFSDISTAQSSDHF